MSDEIAKKWQDAYNLFASVVGIEPKDYTIFKVDNDGDTLTITPGRPAIRSFEDAVKKALR
jgi:hypothetical protein